ncbi:hypothetical protein [Hymenobacter sp. IS2118]|uniref:hypothetical protein n=1 Tax=Hymenobacter sp. IS2118 TaxID=1505605 RepID=UPI001268C682|nr:hypothetical protein [Hymenobacter sp. IS2118]
MRRAARLGLMLALATGGLPALAQTLPAPAASTRPDSVKIAPPTFVVDTARNVTVVTAEPSEVVTRPLAWRIGAAILVLTLTTLLLYNVRSR